jgi:hypothetical protein
MVGLKELHWIDVAAGTEVAFVPRRTPSSPNVPPINSPVVDSNTESEPSINAKVTFTRVDIKARQWYIFKFSNAYAERVVRSALPDLPIDVTTYIEVTRKARNLFKSWKNRILADVLKWINQWLEKPYFPSCPN